MTNTTQIYDVTEILPINTTKTNTPTEHGETTSRSRSKTTPRINRFPSLTYRDTAEDRPSLAVPILAILLPLVSFALALGRHDSCEELLLLLLQEPKEPSSSVLENLVSGLLSL